MNEAVDRLIVQRERLEHGFSRSLVLSACGHLLLIAAVLVVTLLAPRKPPIDIIDAFAVPLPPGGGGARSVEPPAPAPARPQTTPSEAPPEPRVEEPPKVVKPPKEEPPKDRLPEPDAKKLKGKPEPSPPARAAAPVRGDSARSAAGAPGGTGRSSQTPGLEFGPPGPGVPGGTDPMGDWYLAGVQRKIWTIWMQQVQTGFNQPVAVVFTILADGSVTDVRLVESSGATLLDLAAQRAIQTAAPFSPLPKHYGTDRYTIQARFKPTL